MATVHQVLEELAGEGLEVDVTGARSGLDRSVRWAIHIETTDLERETTSDDLIVIDPLTLVDHWPALIAKNPAAVAVVSSGSDVADEPVVEAADAAGLSVLAIPGVVSGPEFAEVVCKVVARSHNRSVESRIEVSRRFDEALVDGAGLGELLSCAADLIEGSVVLTNPSGRVIAAAGPEPEAITVDIGPPALQADVAIGGWHWGTVHAEPGDDVSSALPEAVLDRLPTALAIAHARSSHSHVADEHVGEDLIADLMAAELDASQVSHRVELAGLPTGEGWTYVAAAVRLVAGRPERMALALRSRSINAIQAQYVYDFVVLAAMGRDTTPAELTDILVAALDSSSQSAGEEAAPEISLSAPSSDLGVVAKSLREARTTLALGVELGSSSSVVVKTRDYAVDRLINRIRTDPELVRFRDDFLGPLHDYDESHSSNLVGTLAAYLETGMSKTQTASELSLRRPSLYRRLDRIEELVGSLENPDTRLRLELALKADRQLTASARDSTREAWWMDLGR